MSRLTPEAEVTLAVLRQRRSGELCAANLLDLLSAALLDVLNLHRQHPATPEPLCCGCGVRYPCAERKAISAALAQGLRQPTDASTPR
jgi:hypothetical protein